MKFTYNWLKDYTDIRISPVKLAEKLTMAGLEVVSLQSREGDYIFEVEVTSNRPDWLSIVGIAREVSAITGASLKPLKFKQNKVKKDSAGIKITIENKKDCLLYSARVISGIKVGPSVGWLRKRLELIGCRSVNNVVDITNYCLFELGEPLHAFDLDKINSNKIFVRRGRRGERLITIDGLTRDINEGSLVIADEEKPLALAGIMGGQESEVSYSTTSILLESAVFNPVVIRRQRQLLGMQSESSYRFERGVDLAGVVKASERAAQLIIELCSGEDKGFYSLGLAEPKKRVVVFNPTNLEKISGLKIKTARIKSILSGLGFKVKAKERGLLDVILPSFRQDIFLEEDLIEEIIRIYGYEHIPVTLPKVLPSIIIEEEGVLASKIKDILVGLGLNEAVTYSLTNIKYLNSVNTLSSPIELLNPLSQEQGVLRTTLIPGLVCAVAHNLNQKQDCIALFECAKVFFEKEGSIYQELRLGLALSGIKKTFFNDLVVKDEMGMLNLKGIIETLLRRLYVKEYDFVSDARELRADVYINNEKAGLMQVLSQKALGTFGIKGKDVFVAELFLNKIPLSSSAKKRYVPLSKYPGSFRDISLILKKEESIKNILLAIEEKGRSLLRSLKVSDYYKGRQIPEGYRGLTLELVYASDERTLTEEDVAPLHESICLLLKSRFDIQIR